MLSVDQINNLEAENQKLKSDLQAAVTQYNAVVNQNKDLQTELNQCKRSLAYKINRRLIKEKADALADNIRLKNALKEIVEELDEFCIECQDACKECSVNEIRQIAKIGG